MAQLRRLRGSAMETGEQLQERAQELLGQAQGRNLLAFALVAVSSLMIGMLLGIIFAPSSGIETRSRISERTSGAIENARLAARRRAEELSEEAERIA